MTNIDEEFKINVGKRIHELRLGCKYTLNKLAEIIYTKYCIGIDEKTIRRYEKGESLPKIDNLIILSEIFNVSLDYIMFGKKTSDDNSFK